MMRWMVGVKVWRRAFGTAGWGAEPGFGETGVEAEGIAMPEVDGSVRDWGAGASVEEGDAEMKRNAGLVLGDVGANEFVSDVEGAYLLLGTEGAGRDG
jgi:hypothetical protein